MTENLTDEALEKMAWCDPVAAELLDARKVLEAHRRATPADDLRSGKKGCGLPCGYDCNGACFTTPTTPTDDLRAAVVGAAVEEYDMKPMLDDGSDILGRRCAVRGLMVRLGLYAEFNAALAQKGDA